MRQRAEAELSQAQPKLAGQLQLMDVILLIEDKVGWIPYPNYDLHLSWSWVWGYSWRKFFYMKKLL